MRVATEMYFCCCLTGLGLGLNILVLFPSLSVMLPLILPFYDGAPRAEKLQGPKPTVLALGEI